MIFAIQIAKKPCSSILLLALCMQAYVGQARAEIAPSSVLIYHIQTGDANSTSNEYVSIYNNSDEAADVSGWCIAYASASDVTQTQLACILPSPGVKIMLHPRAAYTFATHEYSSKNNGYSADATFSAGLSGSAGHVKLLNHSKQVMDVIGWGTATKPETKPVTAHIHGKMLQRKHVTTSTLQDTNNNVDDIELVDAKAAQGGNFYEEVEPMLPVIKLTITEIVANPEGADSGKEFIELYNPSNESVNVKEYAIQLSSSYSKSYVLPDKVIPPYSYQTVSDTEIKMTLPNTTAQLRLIGPSGITVDEATAYAEPEEGSSWAFIDDSWQTTFLPTPGAANQLLAIKPCAAGQHYTEDTGKCQKIPAVTTPVACKPGQIRSVETGRCRNAATVASIAPCKAGQMRNPETGRCRNIVVTQATKECPAGQTRNTDTGRCRKNVPAISKATVTDVQTPLVTNNLKWWITGAGLLAAGGYALFEWRKEAFGLALSLRNKFATST